VIVPSESSVAVIVCVPLPTVSSVTLKVPWPSVSAASDGKTRAESLLVIATVPS